MSNKVYKIQFKNGKTQYIGLGLQLYKSQDMAVPCSFEDHLLVMERLGVEATAYSEEFDPAVHTMGDIVEKLSKKEWLEKPGI